MGLSLACADLVGTMRGAVQLASCLRRPTTPVRRRHRVVPGHPAPAGGRLCGHGGSAQRRRCTRRGRWTRFPPPERTGGRGRGQGVLRPGCPRRVRDRDPGARRHREHVGVPGPCLPPASALVERPPRRCRRQPGSSAPATGVSGAAMDFGDSPAESDFRLRLRAWLQDHNPALPTSSTDDEYWAGHGGLAPVALRRRLLRHVLARVDRRPGTAHRLRGDRRRGAGDGRRAAPAESGLPGAGHPRARQRRDQAAVPPRHRQRARPLVSGFQRAGRRVRPGLTAHPGRPGRRRLRHLRPEDVDELLGRGGLVPGAGPDRSRGGQAPRHLGLRGTDAPARASSSGRSG